MKSSIVLMIVFTLFTGTVSAKTTDRIEPKKPMVVNNLKVSLKHSPLPSVKYPLFFKLCLKNVGKENISFFHYDGRGGKGIGTMTWTIRNVEDNTVWKVGRNPNPGPVPGMPDSIRRKTLKPGKSFELLINPLRWGKWLYQGDKEKKPTKTGLTLPPGRYVATLSVKVNGRKKGDWKGKFTISTDQFEVSEKSLRGKK